MENRFRFRTWYTDYDGETEMIYDTQATYDNGNNKPHGSYEHCNFQEVLEDKKAITMQCTGKKDKHNKLIYEGDIVRLTAKNKMTFEYVVKYRLSEYRYVLEYANGKFKGRKARDFSKEYAQVKNLYDGGYEVIGNIYENPELLEGG